MVIILPTGYLMPDLIPVPHVRERLIVVGTSVRKPLPVLQGFLTSLATQELPPKTKLHYVFVPDWPEQNSEPEQYLREWVKERGGECLRGAPKAVGDFADGPGLVTHQWSGNAMRRVGHNKNLILKRALALNADGVFLVDADLILDRTVLASLLAADKPIACAVYWTHWQRPTTETARSFAGPQVWLNHPYGLDGRGYDAAGFRTKLLSRNLTQVWGQGACTLLNRGVLESGVDFTPVPEVSQDGLMAGEDRAFCIRAERAHIPMWADPWADVFHVYHSPEDVVQIPEALGRLGMTHPTKAGLGDLVSLKLEALEPVPTSRGWTNIAPESVRGRLGQIALMPEIEEVVYELQRGESRILKVHCPVHHPFPFYRNRIRLFRVTLVDCKPFGFPPVVETELFVGKLGGGVVDRATVSPVQVASIVETVA